MADQVVAQPTGPSRLQRWFPIGAWLPTYDWGSSLTPDLIAVISVAALLIPESTGDASVAGVPVQIGLYGAACAAVAASNESVEQEGKAAGQTEQDSDRVADPRGRSPEEDA